jgi:SAM-dependent methyltransferase
LIGLRGEAWVKAPSYPLLERYRPEHLRVFTPEERKRFLAGVEPADLRSVDDDLAAWHRVAAEVAWELLYRVEPELYERLTIGEAINAGVLSWLPEEVNRAVEVGAGAGRLTTQLAPRCRELVGVEPSAPLRRRLAAALAELQTGTIDVRPGFFDALPVEDDWADLVVACSAFTTDPAHGGDIGLAEMERVCAPGGVVVVIWPVRCEWLEARGYTTVHFSEPDGVEFGSVEEATALARVFYPGAAEAIQERQLHRVPYDVLGAHPPNSLSWKRVA